jgi:hypothetical protein
MSVSPRTVTEDVVFAWDGVKARLAKGQVLAVAAGSALEKAIGLHRLIPHGLPVAAPPAVQPPSAPAETLTVEVTGPQQEDKPAPKAAAQVKKQDAGKDGEVTDGG